MRFLRNGMISIGIIATLFWISSSFIHADEIAQLDRSLEPPVNAENKYRIGYIEGDPFVNFAGTLNGIIRGLEQLGWVNDTSTMPYRPGQEDSRVIWQWLQSNNTSDYIDFVEDAYYSLLFMSETEIEEMLNRMKEEQDLDLVIVMGTRSGVLMSSIDHTTPFMSFSVTDAVSAGIVKSAEDSGYDHIWAHMDPDRTKRQIHVFHDIFEFNTLGIVYEDTPSGRSVTALDDILEVANERGINVVERHVMVPQGDFDYERYYNELISVHEELAKEVDALYLTYGDWGMDMLLNLLQPLINNNIPVFSQTGAEEVRNGVLISVSRADFNSWGQFGAENIVRALKGSSMRELPQILADTPGIALNLQTAEKIGYQIPFEILLVADEIYQTVGTEENE